VGNVEAVTTTYRQPTVDEAVSMLMKSMTLAYRRTCLKDWREKFGDAFADAVASEFRAKFEKRKAEDKAV
jgi:hypothetical protein